MTKCIRHRHSLNGGTPTYRSWKSMRRRANNTRHHCYKNYGGRGIKVAPEWNRFENFLRDMGERPPGTTLDRIDPNGNYEAANCRWASSITQARNKRANVLLTYEGETLCAVEWAERLEIAPSTLYKRISKGWSHEKALTTPVIVRSNAVVVP